MDFARNTVTALFATTVLLILAEAIWPGSVAPYISFLYLIVSALVFGALTVWVNIGIAGSRGKDEDRQVAEAAEESGRAEASKARDVADAGRHDGRAGKQAWLFNLSLLLVLAACFFVRYYYARVGNINLDEGNGLYDANLVLQGKIPFRDFSTRDPGQIYALALSIKVFGYNMMAGRLLAVVSSIVICFFVFKIGEELYGKKVGLLAALIYSVSPLLIQNDILAYHGPLAVVWIPVSVYCLIRAIKRNRLEYCVLSGVFIGIAMLFYRGNLVYLALCPLALFYIRPLNLRDLITRTAAVVLGFCLPVVPVLAYFVLQTDMEWMAFHYQVPFYMTVASHSAVPGGEEAPYFIAKSRGFYCLFRYALYLCIPLLLFITALIGNVIKSRKTFLAVAAILWGFVLYLVVHGKLTEWYAFGQPPLPPGYDTAFFCLLGALTLFGILFTADRRFGAGLAPRVSFANTLVTAWFLCAALFFIVSPTSSIIELTPIAIMAAVAIYAICRQRNTAVWRILSIAFVILLVCSAVFAWLAYVNTPNPDYGITMSTLDSAAQYIDEHTEPADEIFTCIPAFAVQADRRIVFDISHPLTYVSSEDHPWEGWDPYGTTPSTTEIAHYMESNRVEYVVWERRAGSIVGRHAELVNFILDNYHPVVAYHDLLETHILERNE